MCCVRSMCGAFCARSGGWAPPDWPCGGGSGPLSGGGPRGLGAHSGQPTTLQGSCSPTLLFSTVLYCTVHHTLHLRLVSYSTAYLYCVNSTFTVLYFCRTGECSTALHSSGNSRWWTAVYSILSSPFPAPAFPGSPGTSGIIASLVLGKPLPLDATPFLPSNRLGKNLSQCSRQGDQLRTAWDIVI